ncbi:glutathione S-transferase [Leucosporidium creatinivorum]|uniref:Glutathione S-transferase n=1 Tax=Leucosporidium creatinivorum TaxID=106004 RepID=A0A1Y2FYM9_9BASI|nr:glutathione S-transferase [Leucosporidium creatinivorum]
MSNAPPTSSSGIDLYHFPTPNGLKATVAFEELKSLGVDVKYTSHFVNIMKGETRAEWYTEISPNSKIPAIVDHDRNGAKVWESGSIFLYLAKHYDTSYKLHFENDQEEAEMISWIFLGNTALGPQAGAVWGLSHHPEKQRTAMKTHIAEVKRLYGVYEKRLTEGGGREYLVGAGKGKFSFADIAAITWVRIAPMSTGDPTILANSFPNLFAWSERILAREGVKKGIPEGEYFNQMRSQEGWEEGIKKGMEWVWEEDEAEEGDKKRKKDEL